MANTLILSLSLPLLAYFSMAAYLYSSQRSHIYYPTAEANLDAKSLVLNSDGESIKVWMLNEGRSKAIIYFGGNAEAIEHNIPEFKTLFPEYSVYLPNYRGYGGSSGMATELGLYEDALALYDHIESKYKNISIIGRSLGSGVASYLATKRNIEKCVFVTPYDSITNIAQAAYPIFPISIMLKDNFDSFSRVHAIDAQTLIVIAEQDQVIPLENSRRLADAFRPGIATVEVLSNTAHNTISSHPRYNGLLKNFF